MSTARTPKTVKLLRTLVVYDGPQVVLLESTRNQLMPAVAVTKRAGMLLPFFACEVFKKDFAKYAAGKADLHYLFRSAAGGRYYFFDWACLSDDTAELTPATQQEAADEGNFPQPGFFAESHTHPLDAAEQVETVTHTFNIGGSWEAKSCGESGLASRTRRSNGSSLNKRASSPPRCSLIRTSFTRSATRRRWYSASWCYRSIVGRGNYMHFTKRAAHGSLRRPLRAKTPQP
jgi:hypothetical protein